MEQTDQNDSLSEEELDSISGGSVVVDFRITGLGNAAQAPTPGTSFVPTSGADRME